MDLRDAVAGRVAEEAAEVPPPELGGRPPHPRTQHAAAGQDAAGATESRRPAQGARMRAPLRMPTSPLQWMGPTVHTVEKLYPVHTQHSIVQRTARVTPTTISFQAIQTEAAATTR